MVLAVLSGCVAERGPLEVRTGHPLDATIWDIASGRQITPDELVAKLASADISIIGEFHDNALQHQRQAWLVARIKPAGIAFEMIPEGSEEGIAVFQAQGGKPGEIGPAIGWDRLGWPDWKEYRPIFEAADGAYIAGGGVARRDLSRAIRIGAASVYGEGVVDLGLTKGLPQTMQARLENDMIAAHCNMLPREAAVGMVEAQRLRDARFAVAVLRAREHGIRAGGPPRAVLITGNGHARNDRGVPRYLETAAPKLSVLSIGMLEMNPAKTRLADYTGELPYDFVWFSPPADRGDPCEGFGK